jgi:hypothetical protein
VIATWRRGCNLVAIVAILALAACSPEIVYVTMPEPEPAALPTEEAAPVWQPEAGHVYILDSADAIVVDYTAESAADYQRAVRAWGLNVEMHNLIDDPGGLDVWRLVCGGWTA